MSTYADEVLADGPLYWWRLQEANGPLLISRQPNPLAVMRGVGVVMGRGVAEDDGSVLGGTITGARVYVTGLASPGVALPVFTWEAWVYTISQLTSQDGPHLGDLGNLADGEQIAWSSINGWCLDVKIGGATTINVIASHTITGPLEWHYLALTYDGTDYELFVDAISRGTATHAIAAPGARGPFGVLGTGGNAPIFEGAYIAEPAIYDYVVSSSRLLAHYVAGSGAFGPAIGQPLPNSGQGSINDVEALILQSVRRTY